MKCIEYKNVKVQPRLESYDEWLEKELKFYVERFEKEKADPEHYIGEHYDQTVEQYKESLTWVKSDWRYWDRCNKWYVIFDNGRIVSIPKRKYAEDNKMWEARLDRVISKVEKQSNSDYGKFACIMQKIVNSKLDKYGWLVYPTTYGIGLEAIFNWHFDKQSKEIEELLNKMGVEFKTEYSDAGWIFRYKISKKEANRFLLSESLKQEQ